MIKHFLEKYLPDKKLVKPAEFVIKMMIVYASWRAFKHAGDVYDNFLWGGWQHFKDILGSLTAAVAAKGLLVLGYKLSYHGRVITVDGTAGIYFADLCLGLAPMVIFAGFIVSYGNNLKAKCWFIPFGVMSIFLLNAVRMMALVLLQTEGNKSLFRFAHDYLYVIVTYGFIFLMVMWWMNSLADKKT